jgi:hypothetical protein
VELCGNTALSSLWKRREEHEEEIKGRGRGGRRKRR